jgi:hypothetical protein
LALVAAVRDDIQQTLRVAWLHPGIEVAAAQPVFLAAAWSSIRPNVGRTFDLLAADVRAYALRALRDMGPMPALRERLERTRPPADLERMITAVTAAQFAAARNQIAVHLLTCAACGDAVGGTGEEEPPGRRGTPHWQLWMSSPHPIALPSIRLDQAERAMGAPTAPSVLWLLSQWPDVLEETWAALRPLITDEAWKRAAGGLHWVVRAGLRRLPHEVSLQWHALRHRGFSEEDQAELVRVLAVHERSMPPSTLTAAFVWLAFAEPGVI